MSGDEQRAAEYAVVNGWLVLDTGRHNCGTGPGGHYGTHEPGCGLEPLEQIDVLLSALASVLAKRDAAAEARGRAEGRTSRYYAEADVVLALADDFLIEHPPEHGEVDPDVVYDWFVRQANLLTAEATR